MRAPHPQEEALTGIIGFLLLGLIAGLIARAINNGPEPAGLLGTLVIGVAGAIIGGVIASAIGIGGLSSFFSVGTWITAILGALLFLFIYGAITDKTGATAH